MSQTLQTEEKYIQEVYMNLKTLLALSTIIPTLIISITLAFSRKERAVSNRLLGVSFFIIALLTISTILLSSYDYINYFPVAHLFNLSIMLLGPLFFLYVKSCLEKDFSFKIHYLLHFISFIIVFAFFLYKTLYHDLFYGKHTNQNIYKIIESVQNAVYFFLIPVVAAKNKISVRHFFCNFKDLRITWIRFLFFSLIFICVNKFFVIYVYDYLNNVPLYFQMISYYFIFIGCFFSIATYVLMNRDRLFSSRNRYALSPLSAEEKERIFRTLTAFMEKEKPYLDPDLTQNNLSDAVKIPVKTLSRIVNEIPNFHFNEFINMYRVEHACRLLEKNENNLSILEILFESGFNSKSVFNSAFKKIKGVTPREYKNTCNH